MESEFSKTARTGRVLGSWLGLKLLALPLVTAILVGGVALTDLRADTEPADRFVCRTAQQWQRQYGRVAGRLRVLRVDVGFPGRRGRFDGGEGVVVAPVGLDLDGLQKVVATEASPAGLGTIEVEGVVNQIWEYPGSLRRDLGYTALTLVRPVRASFDADRDEPGVFEALGLPTLDFVRSDVMYEAALTASQTGEHGLDECEEFASWAAETAGWGDPSQRFLAIARRVASGLVDGARAKGDENVCTAVRENRFSAHQAQVAAVMGARAAGLPAFSLTGGQAGAEFLAAVWTGGRGWRVINLEDPGAGFLSESPPMLAKAPVLADFPAADHGFWDARATAFAPTAVDGRYPVLSRTAWMPERVTRPPLVPTTRVRAMPLSEVCR